MNRKKKKQVQEICQRLATARQVLAQKPPAKIPKKEWKNYQFRMIVDGVKYAKKNFTDQWMPVED